MREHKCQFRFATHLASVQIEVLEQMNFSRNRQKKEDDNFRDLHCQETKEKRVGKR